jgi:hypothetical protein
VILDHRPVRLCGYGVNAAFMSLERHERRFHTL